MRFSATWLNTLIGHNESTKHEARNPKQIQSTNDGMRATLMVECFCHLRLETFVFVSCCGFRISDFR
jgi:hypothetical protein